VLRVGLTGGIACGKSVVGQMLVAEGAHLLEADKLSHELMKPGKSVYEEVVRRFGRGLLMPDGEIDRPVLAGIVFADKKRLEELNSIVHPAVIQAQEQWMDDVGRNDPSAIAIIEAALIYEAGLAEHFDKVITVTCTPQDKLTRLARRMGVEPDVARVELERRSSAQIPDEEKVRRAHYVIDNSGSLTDTLEQVRRLADELKRLARQSETPRTSL
jgi:dephospho-CoA kinase